jgi:hypothetical protein
VSELSPAVRLFQQLITKTGGAVEIETQSISLTLDHIVVRQSAAIRLVRCPNSVFRIDAVPRYA